MPGILHQLFLGDISPFGLFFLVWYAANKEGEERRSCCASSFDIFSLQPKRMRSFKSRTIASLTPYGVSLMVAQNVRQRKEDIFRQLVVQYGVVSIPCSVHASTRLSTSLIISFPFSALSAGRRAI